MNMLLFSLVCLTINISAFHFLLHWISWSPDHYHHDYLSDPAQPVPLALWDGICSAFWATHPCTFPVLPCILCSSHRGTARCESGQSGPHYPGRATGHCVGLSFITGRPFSHGVHLPWSSAACSGTSPVYCRYKWDIHHIHYAEIHISSQKETSVKEYLSLFRSTGPNNVSLFKSDGEPSEVNSKLLLYYTPQVIIFPVIHLIHTLSHTTYSWSRRLSRPPWAHWLLTDP